MTFDSTSNETDPELIELSLKNDWSIQHHRLFNLLPENASEMKIQKVGFTAWDLYFLQDLLLIENDAKGLLLDVGWYPHADPKGTYRLILVRRSEEVQLDADDKTYQWDSPIVDFETRSLTDLVGRLQQIIGSP